VSAVYDLKLYRGDKFTGPEIRVTDLSWYEVVPALGSSPIIYSPPTAGIASCSVCSAAN
jgi:hypothetical protein